VRVGLVARSVDTAGQQKVNESIPERPSTRERIWFLSPEAEDLVPALTQHGNEWTRVTRTASAGGHTFRVDGYRPRLPFTSSRREVLARLGSPSLSRARISDPLLGEYGEADSFTRANYAIHVEYRLDVDVINKITLMRADVVPRPIWAGNADLRQRPAVHPD
jgi:hypothetical protein